MKEGIDYYKSIRADIPRALPYWPLGTADSRDSLLASALVTDAKIYVAVWRRGGNEGRIVLPLAEAFHGKRPVEVRCAYPVKMPCNFDINPMTGELTVDLPKPVMARIFEITLR